MTSKGPRSKLDHETRARRQKALDAPREPCRPKTHWDHVLEEMVWLSKDFESERKFKLALAKKVALKASKGMLDQATKDERRVKEKELRLRKVALNISKDMKKFWLKIEKLVIYKHRLEVENKKKKALDKQLEFLLGQTERYSTMLAENLIDAPNPQKLLQLDLEQEKRTQYQEVDRKFTNDCTSLNEEPMSDPVDSADNIDNIQYEDEYEDDVESIAADETIVSKEETAEELAALRSDADFSIADLNCYAVKEGRPNALCDVEKFGTNKLVAVSDRRCLRTNDQDSGLINHLSDVKACQHNSTTKCYLEGEIEHAQYDFSDDQEDDDFDLAVVEDKDDEETLSDEEKLAKAESNESIDEISILQKESEIPVEELYPTYNRDCNTGEIADDDSNFDSEEVSDCPSHCDIEMEPQPYFMDEDDEPCEPELAENQEDGPDIKLEDEKESEDRIADAAEAARSAQPTGNTFSTTNVRTKFPFLLKHPLREYQHIGLDWLVTMYEKRLNGILADEMGLGKTIMTIALLAHLACEKGIWAPHLIVVPTSVLLNWETEFLKWCPALKILTYFGSAKERKHKRQGWLKPNSFHVCITTYRLVIQDAKAFKRKKWKYLILDEAHLIKNWKSQRWQTLLNFNSKRRILLTGTPLQNDLMELWSLMHFLMPHIFQSHQEFKDWFCNPISGMVEGQEKINKEVVDRLHNVLRPFILRRLKRDVEKQLPLKYEHVVFCRLSRRQRNLYEDFIASSDTQATLASANFFGMISVIMQLRKVCNHPDLFEGRPIISSFDMGSINFPLSSSICSMLSLGPFFSVDLRGLGFFFTHLDFSMAFWEYDEVQAIATPSSFINDNFSGDNSNEVGLIFKPHVHNKNFHSTSIFHEIRAAVLEQRLKQARERASSIAWWNSLKCRKKPMYSTSLRELVTVKHPVYDIHDQKEYPLSHMNSSTKLANMLLSPVERFHRMIEQVECFMFAIPAARAPSPVCWCRKNETSVFLHPAFKEKVSDILLSLLSPIRPAIVRRQVYFPDRRLIQFDCGKLQELAVLLRRLKSEGHRALIFTQMTKMLDILEAFINLYGYTYMRLDGSTLPEARQTLMQRFNTNPKFFIFILSTRSGGVGINLVGADTVIFYDSDWNPAMDQQAQDRCHRIGQTREVHIYRLISESTIEENILKKANQKRALDDLVIQSGGYNTDFFKKLDPMELFSGHRSLEIKHVVKDKNNNNGIETDLSNADVEAALKNVEDEADYMALKKIEEEEAVENQEFTEEVIGKMEDDELVNEEEWKGDESADPAAWGSLSNKDSVLMSHGSGLWEEGDIALTNKEDDIDMLADIRHMTEVTIETGQEVISFEDQLRPIDRYAMRFLESVDPIVDKAAIESKARFEETEWELDRIEKLKEDMEAEIDDDEEPFVYECWDADFATEAYRQQVEALTQNQLIEELENEAREREADVENFDSMKNHSMADYKPRSRKKPKKKKFKSLKKGTLDFDSRIMQQNDFMLSDDEVMCHSDTANWDIVSPQLTMQKKRKKVETAAAGAEESIVMKKSKKTVLGCDSSKLGVDADKFKDLELSQSTDVYLESKSGHKSRFGGKFSITTMPVKRIFMIKPEKSKKKGSMCSKDCFPSPDSWLPQEDSILCAVVHEYGPNWCLVSETLYGMTAGGFFRGRYRHPIHCCERFRELIHKYVLSTAYQFIHEKTSNVGSLKGLLKVTEDNLQMLLEFISGMQDDEFLLQKHFTALLCSIWRVKSNFNRPKNAFSSQNGFTDKQTPNKMNFIHLARSRNLLADALKDVDMKHRDPIPPCFETQEVLNSTEHIEIILEFQKPYFDPATCIPSHINVVIYGSDVQHSAKKLAVENYLLRSRGGTAENRFRAATGACVEGSLGWASSPFSVKSRPSSKSPAVGKPKSKLKKCLMECSVAVPTDADLKFDDSKPLSTSDVESGFEELCDVDEYDDDVCNVRVPHEYIPGFISDLDECSSWDEFTDFG